MRRAGFLLLGASLTVMPVATATATAATQPSTARPAPARQSAARPIVTEQENIVDHLRVDPYFFTDQLPRLLTPSVIATVRSIIATMPVPTYLMVTITGTNLVPIVHDRLGRDGVYVAISPDGLTVNAEQFGAGKDMQVRAAAEDITWTMPYNAGLVRVLDRFVADVRSGDAAGIEQADYRRHGGRSPKQPPDPATAAHRYGLAAGAALGLMLAAALLRFRWQARRPAGRPGGRPSGRLGARRAAADRPAVGDRPARRLP